jgi:hypothetical protein
VLAVAVGQVGELLGVSFLKKAQLRILCELVAEHLVCSLAASRRLHPTLFTRVRGRGILRPSQARSSRKFGKELVERGTSFYQRCSCLRADP